MSKATNKLASGIRKAREQQSTPTVAVGRPARQPSRARAERVETPGRAERGGFLHPARVWPD